MKTPERYLAWCLRRLERAKRLAASPFSGKRHQYLLHKSQLRADRAKAALQQGEIVTDEEKERRNAESDRRAEEPVDPLFPDKLFPKRPLASCMSAAAAQEGCDGEEYNLLEYGSKRIEELEKKLLDYENCLIRIKCLATQAQGMPTVRMDMDLIFADVSDALKEVLSINAD